LKNKICHESQSIRELLLVLNQQPGGFSFIVNNKNKLKGVITDGDIRRFLLQGYGLNHMVSDLKIKMCAYALEKDDYASVFKKMNNRIRVIPIVNEEFEPIDYVQYDKRKHTPVAMPSLEGNELNYVTDAVLSTWISSSGKYINNFEKNFSHFINMDYGVTTSNGTVALHLALLALGVGKGDEVIIPDLTFAATINAVLYVNATPVLVDVEKDSWCIDPLEIKKAITLKTKAIIPVHLYGQACDMAAIMPLAKEYRLLVVEDCAEAHGAMYKGQKVGSFGDISCFSFFGNKIITTGEGGMCLTNSEIYNMKMRQLRDHGMSPSKRYWHDVVGYNYRMTNIQAAIGCAQLERIDSILEMRSKIEESYNNIFENFSFISVQTRFSNRRKVTWLVSALIDKNSIEDLILYFQNSQIDVRRFFIPLSTMPIYKKYLFSNKNSKYLSLRGVIFPTHKMVNFKLIEKILKNFLSEKTL
jgi:perosamine synthetase